MENPADDSAEKSQNKSLIDAEDTPDQVCSPKECTKTPELYITSLKCHTCDRSVHYRCTGLPPYMIEFFARKFGGKQRKWSCQNCIQVSKEVKEATIHDSSYASTISHLRKDVSACEGLIKAQRETISHQNSEIQSLRKCMEVMTAQIGVTETLSRQINDLENKLMNTIESKQVAEPTKPEMTFANVVKSSPTNLREIIKEARNEEYQEDRDKKSRKTNIIIHGVADKKFADQKEQETWNDEFSNKLLLDLKVAVKKKKAIRLGTFNEDKQRPIKMVFTTVKDKETIMKNLKNLKGIEGYGKMSITEDHTKAERELIKSWASKAKELNAKEPKESSVVWRLRGSPDSGIYLKKFDSKNQASQ